MMMITTNEELKAFCGRMSKLPFITVDTEFLREKTYWAQLCLIQVASETEAACVDPLADGLDLAPLLTLMKNPKVLKVFHAARQDLEIFHMLMHEVPSPVFDTQVAAMVCGFEENVSYQNLVSFFLKKNVDKTSRVTDWSVRPLSEKQIQYALSDVTYLVDIYKSIRDFLKAKGRTHWVDSEMEHLKDESLYVFPPEEAWKRLKCNSNSPRFLARLQMLAAWREREAQRTNLPRKHVLRDETLLEMASTSPTDVADLFKMRSKPTFSPKSEKGKDLLTVLKIADALPDELLPQPEKKKSLSPFLRQGVEAMRMLLSAVAAQNGVAQKLIATTADLEEIVSRENAQAQALQGWRREIFGEKALAFKNGKLGLCLNPKTREIEFFDRNPSVSSQK